MAQEQVNGSTQEVNGNTQIEATDLSAKARKKWEAGEAAEHVIPPVKDLTIENITANVIAVNSNIKDNPRLQYIITKLIQVSHDYIRDVDLKFDEWTTAWQFLTKVRPGLRQPFL